MLLQIQIHIMKYFAIFFPNVIKSWNGLSNDLKSSASLGNFKHVTLSLIRPPCKSVFGAHDPIGLKYIFRLRVGLSPLNCHKRNHNFIDTPSSLCDCQQAPEDTIHFLLECSKFIDPRKLLISAVTKIIGIDHLSLLDDINLFLYGSPYLSQHQNQNILLSTIRFIKETDRFT